MRQIINVGATDNDGTGDPIRAAFTKTNAMFAELYSKHHISAYSTVTQTNSATTNLISYNNIDIAQGISINNATQITVTAGGVYNIQFSAQLDRTVNGTDQVTIWLLRNGVAIPWTASHVTLSGTAAAAKLIPAWNFLVAASAGDYFELAWSSAEPAVRLLADAANNPAVPSIILTMVQI